MFTLPLHRTVQLFSLITVSATICCAGVPARAIEGEVGRLQLAQALRKAVLVFPFDVSSTVSAKEVVREILTDSASSRLMASNVYTVVQFHKTLPTVARLHLDQQLSDSDVSEPYADDNVKGVKVTKAAGYDYAFLGSVDDYQWNEATKSVDLVVSGRIIDVKTSKLIGTPVTLKASSSSGGNAKEPARAAEAARNAGQTLMQKLVPIAGGGGISAPVKEPKVASAPKKKKNNDVLWGLLAVGLGLGIGLASSGRGHGGSGGSDNPPPPP